MTRPPAAAPAGQPPPPGGPAQPGRAADRAARIQLTPAVSLLLTGAGVAALHSAGCALVLGAGGDLAGVITPADFARAVQFGRLRPPGSGPEPGARAGSAAGGGTSAGTAPG